MKKVKGVVTGGREKNAYSFFMTFIAFPRFSGWRTCHYLITTSVLNIKTSLNMSMRKLDSKCVAHMLADYHVPLFVPST
jgi:hypothetical protein